MYLKDSNRPLITVNDKLNSLFAYAPSVLNKKYNIDIKKLVLKYLMPVDLLEEKELAK